MNKPKLMLIIGIVLFLLVFFIYAFWIPSSQVYWKTMHKTNDGSILLTFDDGPGPETPIIIETLLENNMSAIFFVACDQVSSEDVAVLKNMSANGFIIGLHGQRHVINEDYNSLKECKDYLENITGESVIYYRPPYGFKAPRTMKAIIELNMTPVLWSVFPRDYSAKSSDLIVKRVTRDLEPGDIVCMHDGPENRVKTAQALPEIISYLKNN